jgi:malonyl-CoA O-methyltransferase
MLARCRARLGDRHRYLVLDGERPDGLEGGYDLIVSNLTFQWFVDLAAACQRLSGLLAPGGRLAFATLGRQTFGEWRQAHAALGLSCGTPQYPTAEEFPWPDGIAGHTIAEELIRHRYDNGHDFARSLKVLGASEPAPGYRPLSPGAFRKLLASLAGGFTVTYHILFGEITA